MSTPPEEGLSRIQVTMCDRRVLRLASSGCVVLPRQGVRQALLNFFGDSSRAADEFDDEDLDLLWRGKYRTGERLRGASREGLQQAGLAPASIDLIMQHKGESPPWIIRHISGLVGML
jgi:hypothetical protein